MSDKRSPRRLIILKEAARLFSEKGYMASTLRELAKRSGVQGGSIYHHFSSKQEILYQIMDYTMTNLIYRLESEINDIDDPPLMLKKAVGFHIAYHVTERCETFVTDTEIRALSGSDLEKIIRKRSKYEKIFRDILDKGNDSGLMKVTDTKIAAKAILQMCTGVSYWYRDNSHLKIDEITDKYLDLIVRGVAGEVNTVAIEGAKL